MHFFTSIACSLRFKLEFFQLAQNLLLGLPKDLVAALDAYSGEAAHLFRKENN